ncbi:transaldolase [Laccaria bicolor S238N-H82]|uniref:Transaldolase n=1 Tax=Laccaria bicolor (strain S238N-H82 / ATCC MYA-4686) TaxID=486041 RepID=B0DJS4_LACBS|nr:transaldolase [Laccaria bicolor S238N-H82]EDR05260.1 transaldolase [Laccaria bicolor S238N-H82]|eukprot:XP_001884225.1 transaldolase [Laccaria bicolor S238N-H82]
MATDPEFEFTALDAIRQSGIVIASDGAEYLKIKEFNPIDATSNPSLVSHALSKPEYAHIFTDAVHYACSTLPTASLNEQTDLAMDKLLVQVGAEILNIIPGRVSVSVDPRLGYDYHAILTKAKSLTSLFNSLSPPIPPSRFLIKIPATYPGILAAHTLESLPSSPIHTNLTLVFGQVQAVACAQAGVSVVSPFVGRVKDWCDARARLGLDDVGHISDERKKPAIETHPGLNLLRDIRNAYTQLGTKTQIMAAGFRSVDELVEVGRHGSKGGPDLVTLPPELLDGLRRREGVRADSTLSDSISPPWALPTSTIPVYFNPTSPDPDGTLFENALKEEGGIALDKVPEGLEKFSRDARKLEGRVRCALEVLREAEARGKSQMGVGQTSTSDACENGQLDRTTTTLVAKKGLEGIEWVEQTSSLNLNLCAGVQEGVIAVGQCLGQSVKVI